MIRKVYASVKVLLLAAPIQLTVTKKSTILRTIRLVEAAGIEPLSYDDFTSFFLNKN